MSVRYQSSKFVAAHYCHIDLFLGTRRSYIEYFHESRRMSTDSQIHLRMLAKSSGRQVAT